MVSLGIMVYQVGELTMEKLTDWEVRPLDEYGDTIEVYFCESLEEARCVMQDIEELHGDEIDDWLLERHDRWYASDGELKNERYTKLEW